MDLGMNIASLATNLSQVNLLNKVGTAVLGNAMDMQETEAAGLINMIDAASMERSVYPNIGSNFDMSV